jgi:transcriptional regulator with XRE-family HTH domain
MGVAAVRVVPYVDTVLAMGRDQDYVTEVRHRREQLGLSVAELAAAAHVNEDTVRNIEGKRAYRRKPAALSRLLEVLDRLEAEVPGPRVPPRVTMSTTSGGRRYVVEGDTPADAAEAMARLMALLPDEGAP